MAAHTRSALADQHAADRCHASAELAPAADLLDVFVRVEATDEPFAVRIERPLEDVDADLGASHRPPGEIDDGDLRTDVIPECHAGLRPDADQARRRPERDAGRDRLDFARRVAEFELGQQVAWRRRGRQAPNGRARRPGCVERELVALMDDGLRAPDLPRGSFRALPTLVRVR